MAVIVTDEPSEFMRPDEELEIFSYFELVRILKLDRMSATDQAKALVDWTKSHPVNEVLAASLHEHAGINIRPTKAQVTA